MTDLLQSEPSRFRPVRPRVADDANDIELLHSISVALIGEQDRQALYGKIVEAAVAITGSQFGTMQRLCPKDDPSGHGGELQLLAHRGLPPEAVGFWGWVPPGAHSSCTQALKLRRRAVIADFEAWEDIAGTEDLAAFRRTGIRSAQTTPLVSRGGELLGMISTHWDEPHEPTGRDLRLLDILARQAADLLERTVAEEALRNAEIELRRLNDALEARVRARTDELAAAEGRARQTSQALSDERLTGGLREQFIAVLGHDLRNPLSALSSGVRLLQRDPSREKAAKIAGMMHASVLRMSGMIENVLDFARGRLGGGVSIQRDATDLETAILQVVDELRSANAGHRIELRYDLPALVDCDGARISQMLSNLIGNACSYGDPGAAVVVRASRVGDEVEISVANQGPAIPESKMATLFQPFSHEPGLAPVQGLGLGLFIASEIAKSHGGALTATSSDAETRFTFRMPMALA